MNKEPKNTGNKNAQTGDEAKAVFLHMRIEPKLKAKFVNYAQNQKMTLAAFVTKACNNEVAKNK